MAPEWWISDAPDLSAPTSPAGAFRLARHKARARRKGLACSRCNAAVPCVIGRASRGPPLDSAGQASRDGFGKRCGTVVPRAGEVRRRARSGILREQGVLGECGTMTRACRETPGGAGGVANDDPVQGVQRGGARFGPADGPRRVWEGGAPPERRVSAAGVRGRQPPANDSWNAGP